VGAIARRLQLVQSREKALSEAQQKLIDSSVGIFDESPSARDAAFIARELVLASLPHSNPGDRPVWTRRNGKVTLAIQPGVNIQTGESYGYPYGGRVLFVQKVAVSLLHRSIDDAVAGSG
jgi:hypothetical protein